MTPPDGLPDWITADSSRTEDGLNTKGIAVVFFSATSTPVTRAAAVDSVGGIVVGGLRVSDDGYYYIQIPDSGTGLELQAAIDKLSTLSQVDVASLDYRLGSPAYLEPQDGPDWTKADWSMSPDSASGQNWALEAVAAPLAWGCSVGNVTTKVAVLDVGFDSTEIASNTGVGASLFGALSTTDTVRHGTAVSNIIAARGNDGYGMTGIMWRGDLQLYTPSTINAAVIGYAVKSAADAGASVINISYYISWRRLHNQMGTV